MKYVVSAGQTVSGAALSRGDVMEVLQEGIVSEAAVLSGGRLHVDGGTAMMIDVSAGGRVRASNGGRIVGAGISSGGRLDADYGVRTADAVVFDGGRMYVSGGEASSFSVLSGGTAGIQNGGMAQLGAAAGKLVINSGAIGWSAFVLSGGILNVGGIDTGAGIFSGGLLNVKSGGAEISAVVSFGGRLNVLTGGSAMSGTIQQGGMLAVYSGASAAGMTVSGRAILRGAAVIEESFTVASGAVVSGGSTEDRVKLFTGARLEAAGGARMDKLHLDARGADLIFAGPGNRLGTVLMDAGTNMTFNVTKSAPGQRAVLAANAAAALSLPKFGVLAGKAQMPGYYGLCAVSSMPGALTQGSFTLTVGEETVKVKLDWQPVSAGGMNWRLGLSGSRIAMTAAVRKGWMKKDAGLGYLEGSEDGDVFAGGSGNDAIVGSGGRDCAVWGTEDWGMDSVAETSGTMTVVFSGLSEADVTQTFAGGIMTFAKTDDSGQRIRVDGWNAATHSAVFVESGSMEAFGEWVSAAAPTAAQARAARTDVWKAAGLAAG